MSIVPRQLVWYEVNSYVHSQILKTLLEMMRVDNFDSITISRLTAKAEVGRASFYRNYQNKRRRPASGSRTLIWIIEWLRRGMKESSAELNRYV